MQKFRYHKEIEINFNQLDSRLQHYHIDKFRFLVTNLSLHHRNHNNPKIYNSTVLKELFGSDYYRSIIDELVRLQIITEERDSINRILLSLNPIFIATSYSDLFEVEITDSKILAKIAEHSKGKSPQVIAAPTVETNLLEREQDQKFNDALKRIELLEEKVSQLTSTVDRYQKTFKHIETAILTIVGKLGTDSSTRVLNDVVQSEVLTPTDRIEMFEREYNSKK